KKPVAHLTRAHIAHVIGTKASTPEAANNLLKVLRVILNHAVSIDMIPSNPAIGVERFASKGEGIHTWAEAEVAQFEEHFPVSTKARLALALLVFTAARRSDVVRFGWQHVQGDAIHIGQKKTDVPLVIPIHPELMKVLAATPRTNLTFLTTQFGKP